MSPQVAALDHGSPPHMSPQDPRPRPLPPVLSRPSHRLGLLPDAVPRHQGLGPCCHDTIFLVPGVFTECHRKDEDRAQKLLTRVSEAWGKTTCLQLALEAKDMKFVSHGGVQVTCCRLASGRSCPWCCRCRRSPRSHRGTWVPVLRGPRDRPGPWSCAADRHTLSTPFASQQTGAKREWAGGPLPGSLQSSTRPQPLPPGKTARPCPPEPLPPPEDDGACPVLPTTLRGWGLRVPCLGHAGVWRREDTLFTLRGGAQGVPTGLKLPPLSTGLSNQGVVGPALRGQWALAGDHVYAGLPVALYRPHLLQVPAWPLGCRGREGVQGPRPSFPNVLAGGRSHLSWWLLPGPTVIERHLGGRQGGRGLSAC